jgi:hypothetical protein
MTFRRNHSPTVAAAKAGFSATGDLPKSESGLSELELFGSKKAF